MGSASPADSERILRILDDRGLPTPARVVFSGSAVAAVSGARVHNAPDGMRYFYTDGVVRLSPGEIAIPLRVYKGFHFVPVDVTVAPGKASETRVQLRQVIDARARGYYSGDGHVHPMYLGTTEPWSNHEILQAMKAEDLNLVNALSGNALYERVYWRNRVTGTDEPESEAHYVLHVSEEYRSQIYGHMSVFGIARPSGIVFTAFEGTSQPYDYPLNLEAARSYERAGAFASFAHLRPARQMALEAPVDVALGALHAIEVQGYAVSTPAAVTIWMALLNAGFDIVLTAGTDTVLGAERTPVMGGARAYVDLGARPFGYDAWTEGLKRGAGFTTNGPLLFLTVAGRGPGERIRLAARETRELDVVVEVISVFPWNEVRVYQSGRIALRFASAADAGFQQTFRGKVEVSGPGWLSALVEGPLAVQSLSSRRLGTTRAATNAVWIDREGENRRSSPASKYFVDWIRQNLAVLDERNNYGSTDRRTEVRRTLNQAIEVFEERREPTP